MSYPLHIEGVGEIHTVLKLILNSETFGKSLRGVVANVLDCDIIFTEFELQSSYYVSFRTKTSGKGTNLFIPKEMS